MDFAGGLEQIDEKESLSRAKRQCETGFYFGAMEWSAAAVSKNPLNLDAYALFYEALYKLRTQARLEKITRLREIGRIYPSRWIACLYERQVNKDLRQNVLAPYILAKTQFEEPEEELIQKILHWQLKN